MLSCFRRALRPLPKHKSVPNLSALQLIELEGFHLLEKRQVVLTDTHVRDFYAERSNTPSYHKLRDFMISGVSWALIIAKRDAIKAWHTMMGPSDSLVAKEQAPGTIRALYGTGKGTPSTSPRLIWTSRKIMTFADDTRNAVHGSDSKLSAKREIKFFFPHRSVKQVPQSPTEKISLPKALQDALCKGLTVLARTKPSQEPLAALHWLGDWLLNNNPNKPKIISPEDLKLSDIDDESEFLAAGPTLSVSEPAASMHTLRIPTSSYELARQRTWHAHPHIRNETEVSQVDTAVQRTLAMIKPDAVAAGKAQAIMDHIESSGFTICRKRQYTMYPAQAEAFYSEHAGKPFFAKLMQFMTSGPIWALELEHRGAIKEWRVLMGPTNSDKARAEAATSLRALYGTDATQNAVHGSDSPAAAQREISFHFPPVQRTLAMVKPDAVAACATAGIKAMIQAQGFKIVRQRDYQMSTAEAEKFYQEHVGKDFFAQLVEFMTSGPICALEIEGLGAIGAWRAMMGPTNSATAKNQAPSSLRACFGTDGTRNAVHGSDSAESAAREIAFHFEQLGAADHEPSRLIPLTDVPVMYAQQPQEDAHAVAKEMAAVILQSVVRGHQTRQKIDAQKSET